MQSRESSVPECATPPSLPPNASANAPQHHHPHGSTPPLAMSSPGQLPPSPGVVRRASSNVSGGQHRRQGSGSGLSAPTGGSAPSAIVAGSSADAEEEILAACDQATIVAFPTTTPGVDYGGVLAASSTTAHSAMSPGRSASSSVPDRAHGVMTAVEDAQGHALPTVRPVTGDSGRSETYVIVMVGLPAGGKTFLSKKVCRYMNWQGVPSQLHNIGEKWRALVQNDAMMQHAADFTGGASGGGGDGPHGGTYMRLPSVRSLDRLMPPSPPHGAAQLGSTAYASSSSEPSSRQASGGCGAPLPPAPPSASLGATATNTQTAANATHFGTSPSAAAHHQQRAAPTFNIPYNEYDLFAHESHLGRYQRVLEDTAQLIEFYFRSQNGRVALVNDNFFGAERVRELFKSILHRFVPDTTVIFIEVVQNPSELRSTYERNKVAEPGEYTENTAVEQAFQDFRQRVEVLRRSYTSVAAPDRYIRIIDGSRFEIAGVRGYLPSRLVAFVVNLNSKDFRIPIYFARHGQSEYNLEDRLGGNPQLTEKGRADANAIRDFIGATVIKEAERSGREIEIWTSQLVRTMQTAEPAEKELGIRGIRWRALNELHAGVCENLTYDEVKERYPLIHQMRNKSKFFFRYPDGESYQDLVQRLEEIIVELENTDKIIVVVAHQAVLRGLLSYFGARSAEESVHADVPHRTVWMAKANSAGDSLLSTISLAGPSKPPAAAVATSSVGAAPQEATTSQASPTGSM